MSDIDPNDYYRERAATSRQLAERASIPAIRAIHEDFARRYEATVEQAAVARTRR